MPSTFLDNQVAHYPPVFKTDCCHVLGGSGTTAAEEGEVVVFQAGFQ